ncbi:MAG: ATP-binding protein [bacterium]
MPVQHSRRIRTTLWIAALALLVPIGLTLTEIPREGLRAWVRLGALALAGGALGLLMWRQRLLERRLSEQSKAEDALRQSEAKFAGILGIAADAIITVDQAQRIVHFNQGAEQIFGYHARDVMGRHLALLIPARYRGAHDQHLERFARSPEGARRMGERREIFGLRGDGTEFPAEASISKLVAADGILFTVVLRDITDRKRAEEDERFMAETSRALAQSLDFEAAVQATADLGVPRLADVAFVDLLTSSDALRRMPGTRQKQTLTPALQKLSAVGITRDSPSPIVDVIRRRKAEVVAAVDDEWLEANEEDPAAAAAWRELGARSLLIVPLVVGDHVLGAVTLIAVEPQRTFTPETAALATKFGAAAAITLENAQLYAVAQRANRAREAVLGVVSHDLRNPIGAIMMCARTLEENPPDDPAARHELISTIRESASWTNRLIQDLVDVASLEQGRLSIRPHPSDPAQLVLQARHMFEVEAANHGITIAQEIPTNLPLVMADGERVIQVFGNLFRNAIKFTPNGGQITIGVETRGELVAFAVRDSGPGVPLDNQPYVFDRFWQSADGARNRGSGLGLSIAKGIVEAHGGKIWLDSVPNEGATFSFTIPVARGSAH